MFAHARFLAEFRPGKKEDKVCSNKWFEVCCPFVVLKGYFFAHYFLFAPFSFQHCSLSSLSLLMLFSSLTTVAIKPVPSQKENPC